jgi:hypothetical protein
MPAKSLNLSVKSQVSQRAQSLAIVVAFMTVFVKMD